MILHFFFFRSFEVLKFFKNLMKCIGFNMQMKWFGIFFLFFWSFSKSIVILMKWCIGLVCKWNFALVLIFNWNDLAFFFIFAKLFEILCNFNEMTNLISFSWHWLQWLQNLHKKSTFSNSTLFTFHLFKTTFFTQSIFQNFVIFRLPSQYFLLCQFYFKLLYQITLLSICHNEKEKMNYLNIIANS